MKKMKYFNKWYIFTSTILETWKIVNISSFILIYLKYQLTLFHNYKNNFTPMPNQNFVIYKQTKNVITNYVWMDQMKKPHMTDWY